VGNQRGGELIGVLGCIRPAVGIPGEDVPGIGDVGAGEQRKQRVRKTPSRYDGKPNDAGAVCPRPLFEESKKLKQLAELDERGREVEADVQDVE